jgi:Zc3h12a-like Ribonuclease NYN domain
MGTPASARSLNRRRPPLPEQEQAGEGQPPRPFLTNFIFTNMNSPMSSLAQQTAGGNQPTPATTSAASHSNKLVVDGLNLIYAGFEQRPNLTKLLAVLVELKRINCDFICFFDASTYWRLADLPSDCDQRTYYALVSQFPNIFVPVPGGKRADDYILAYANRHNLRVLSNDCYREYIERYPWLKTAPERRIPVLFFGDNYCIEELGIDGQIECRAYEIRRRLWDCLDMVRRAKSVARDTFKMATPQLGFA